ncbi:MAG: serine/threonine-protein kinase RsbW [Actinomycetota bacterium]|nr:serine/threonine-protein kinase RsbW [Actinomycetota bacterium]
MSPQRRFPNEATSVSEARRYTLAAVDDLSPQVADAVAVMVSELAANAVRHTGSHFTLSIDRSPELIRIAVTDGGSGSPIVKNPEPVEPSGRGLQIVQALAADWGVIPASEPPGKTVWFTVAVAVDAALEEQSRAGRRLVEPSHRRDARAGGAGTSPSLRASRNAPSNRLQRVGSSLH